MMNISRTVVFAITILISLIGVQGQLSTNGTQTQVPCKPGINLGRAFVRTPNSTSIVTVGQAYKVSFDFNKVVTKPPKFLDVYVQLLAAGIEEKWDKKVLSNVSPTPNWFFWTPVGLINGKYRLMIVSDGKMHIGVPADKRPCYTDGESLPSSSGEFKVVNVGSGGLDTYPDPFAPSSISKGKKGFSTDMTFFSVLFLLCCSLFWVRECLV